MSQVILDIPDDVLASLADTPERVRQTLRMAAAAKLYEMKQLSSGAAARVAGLPRVEFLQRLGEFGVATFDQDEEDLRGEVRFG